MLDIIKMILPKFLKNSFNIIENDLKKYLK